MRKSRLHKASIWPLIAVMAVPIAILAVGLSFHPRETGFLGFITVPLSFLANLIALLVVVIRAKRRAAAGLIDMTSEPDPAKGEFS